MASITRRNQRGHDWWKPLTDDGVTLMASKRKRRHKVRHPITKDGRSWATGKSEKRESKKALRRQGKLVERCAEQGGDVRSTKVGRRIFKGD